MYLKLTVKGAAHYAPIDIAEGTKADLEPQNSHASNRWLINNSDSERKRETLRSVVLGKEMDARFISFVGVYRLANALAARGLLVGCHHEVDCIGQLQLDLHALPAPPPPGETGLSRTKQMVGICDKNNRGIVLRHHDGLTCPSP